jgi:hypothetical protein
MAMMKSQFPILWTAAALTLAGQSGPSLGTKLVSPDPARISEFTSYLQARHVSGEDYIISLFKTHDVVFLGEGCHHCKPHELFLQRLIPHLYKAGVRIMGYEMACTDDQAAVDALINAPTYDEKAAFRILQQWWFNWAYQEYADVFRAAWQLNRSLPKGAPRFRILAIDAKADYHRLDPGMDATHPAARSTAIGGDIDKIRNTRMADVVTREVLDKGLKALMFNGNGHSQRIYQRPKNNTAERRTSAAFLVSQRFGDRVIGVSIEGPMGAAQDPLVQAILASLKPGEDSVGFSTKGSPIGSLMIHAGKDVVPIDDFYDGYVFHSMKTKWEPGTFRPEFVTDEFVKSAKRDGTMPDRPSVTAETVKNAALKLHNEIVEQLK